MPTSELNLDGRRLLEVIAENDGLKLADFISWFFPKPPKPNERECFVGGIIHLNSAMVY